MRTKLPNLAALTRDAGHTQFNSAVAGELFPDCFVDALWVSRCRGKRVDD